MRQAVASWLNRSGYYDAHECMIGGYCDVIGCMWSKRRGRRKPDLLEMICVELKMRDIAGAISQATGNHYHANLSYCAMPVDFCERMRSQSIQKFIQAGVGLLAVAENVVKILIYSEYRNEMPHLIFRNRLWAFKCRNKKDNKRLK